MRMPLPSLRPGGLREDQRVIFMWKALRGP
jgi:hypothetical protein